MYHFELADIIIKSYNNQSCRFNIISFQLILAHLQNVHFATLVHALISLVTFILIAFRGSGIPSLPLIYQCHMSVLSQKLKSFCGLTFSLILILTISVLSTFTVLVTNALLFPFTRVFSYFHLFKLFLSFIGILTRFQIGLQLT